MHVLTNVTLAAPSICWERALPGPDYVIPGDLFFSSSKSRDSTLHRSTEVESRPPRRSSQPPKRSVGPQIASEDSDEDSAEDSEKDEGPGHEKEDATVGPDTPNPNSSPMHDDSSADSADMDITRASTPREQDVTYRNGDSEQGTPATRLAPWDNGEVITAEERNVLLEMVSDEERARVMNLRRRDRGLLESGEINKVLPIMAKPVYSELKDAAEKGRKKRKGNTKVVDKEPVDPGSTQQRRSSSRHQKQKDLPSKDAASTFDVLAIDTNSTVSPPVTLDNQDTSEEGWPEWMVEAVPHLRGMSGSVQWLSLVNQWIQLESLLGYPTGRVSTK